LRIGSSGNTVVAYIYPLVHCTTEHKEGVMQANSLKFPNFNRTWFGALHNYVTPKMAVFDQHTLSRLVVFL